MGTLECMLIQDNDSKVYLLEFKNKDGLQELIAPLGANDILIVRWLEMKKKYVSNLTTDKILDSINVNGIDNLSKEELLVLLKNNK